MIGEDPYTLGLFDTAGKLGCIFPSTPLIRLKQVRRIMIVSALCPIPKQMCFWSVLV